MHLMNHKMKYSQKKTTKPIEKAEETIDNLKVNYEQLKSKLVYGEYKEDRIYCAIASLVLNHGLLRGSELTNMFVSLDDSCQIPYFFDLENEKMVIVSPLATLAFQLCAVGDTGLKTGWVTCRHGVA